uniref:Uncharacterized protein n=1 Tax=Cucumis melo TaxID=3656 RepID=A0A9I9EHL6_CUCME
MIDDATLSRRPTYSSTLGVGLGPFACWAGLGLGPSACWVWAWAHLLVGLELGPVFLTGLGSDPFARWVWAWIHLLGGLELCPIICACSGPNDLAFCLSTNFWIFPVAVFGISVMKITVFGTINLGNFPLQYSIISSSVGFRLNPSFKLINAHGVSPQNSSGRATTAASFTIGFMYKTDSTSTLLKFSPPLIITSFDRSFISKYPSGCITPTSPVKNHPSSLIAFAVPSGSFKYPSVTDAPLTTISPMEAPSLFTLFLVSGSNTSTASTASIRTPCLAFSRACSIAGSWFHSDFHEQQMIVPALSVNPYPWVTTNPSDSVRSRIDAGGGAPAVRILTGRSSGKLSGEFVSILSTTGAPHKCVT